MEKLLSDELRKIEERETRLEEEKSRFYNLQEVNFKRTYDLANKAIDTSHESRKSDTTFKDKLILILIIGILSVIAIDRVGYYFAPYSVSTESTNTNTNTNTN